MSNERKRKWSLRLEGLVMYSLLLAFFWRDWNPWTAAWLFVPFMVLSAVNGCFEIYRELHPERSPEYDQT